MEYLHASLILHSSGKKITEKAVSDIITAAGLTPDKNRIKGLVAALGDVNIEEALKSAAVMPSVAAAPTKAAGKATGKAAKAPAKAAAPEPEPEEEEEESGLSSLFG
jgi:large subunit ribosomal protein L12